MKKLTLILLLFILTMQGAMAENLYNRFKVGNSIKYKDNFMSRAYLYVITDNNTGQQYIVIENFYQNGCGVSTTPLIKPSVYVHKK